MGALLIVFLSARAMLGPRPRRFALRLAIVGLMLAMSLAGGLLIAPRVEAIRDATPGPITALPDGNATKAEFGRLHGLSNVIAILTIVAGMGLMWFEAKDEH
jgi:hypothetical protein